MAIEVAMPTLNRAGKIVTLPVLEKFESVTLFVHTEEQAEEYARHYDLPMVVTHADGMTGQRNAILDYYPEGTQVIQIDDDIKSFAQLRGRDLADMNVQENKDFCERAFEAAEKAGTKMWGVYPVANAFYMSRTLTPCGFCIGACFGIIVGEIRADPTMPCKQDYDLTLQHIRKYGRIVRYNNVTIRADHYTMKGGCYENRQKRGKEMDIQTAIYLVNKYPGMVKLNTKREGEVLITLKAAR